jgi:hypothetical protein
MRPSSVLKILSVLIIGILLVIAYQILLTTSIFNSVESTLPNSNSVHLGQGVGKVKVYLETEQYKPATDQNDINVMITFTNARHNHNLQSKFRTSVTSMFKWTSSRLNIYIIGDNNSQILADNILKEAANRHMKEYKV